MWFSSSAALGFAGGALVFGLDASSLSGFSSLCLCCLEVEEKGRRKGGGGYQVHLSDTDTTAGAIVVLQWTPSQTDKSEERAAKRFLRTAPEGSGVFSHTAAAVSNSSSSRCKSRSSGFGSGPARLPRAML